MLKNAILYILISILHILSLEIKFLSNLFNIPFGYIYFNSLFFSRQEFLDFLIINLHSTITYLILLYIYFSLFWNMFHYSAVYYLLNWLFDIQRVSHVYTDDIRIYRDYFVASFLKSSKYSRKFLLPFQITDAMAVILLLLFVMVIFNLSIYYNKCLLQTNFMDLSLSYNINFLRWISFWYDSITFGIVLDHLSLLMLVVVLTISTLVHYYSLDYMATDPRLLTFLKYLSGFTLAMVVLITANNFALLFVGWEGVGIFSYLLIGFWYTRTLALKASLKAVIVNRIGDAALIIASALTLHYFGTLEFWWLCILVPYLFSNKLIDYTIDFFFFKISIVTLIAFFLLIAAVGKSAQFGLHTWLPDAMEGPTPVSALIHAATMVTAGVYLIVRTSFFFEFSEIVRNLTLVIGAFTALFGSLTACAQYDIKWIIAFSTCSQLGYMFLACGLSAYNLAMFHLFIHAFFKALLFLCAGSVIHAIGDEQDIRKMGGLLTYLPITYTGLCIGFLSLAGMPFTSGFFSKDTIIELALTKWTQPALYAYICGSLGAFFTAYYSCRFFYYVIFMESNLSRAVITKVSEHGQNMLVVISLLSFITIFIGGITKNPLTSPFSFIFFSDSIFVLPINFYFNMYENFIEFYETIHRYVFNYLKLILFIIPPIAIYIAIINYWHVTIWDNHTIMLERHLFLTSLKDRKEIFDYLLVGKEFYTDASLQKFFETKSGADQVYNKFIVKPLIIFSYQISYKELDWGWLEFFFVKIPTLICFFIGKILNQTFGTLKLNFLPALIYILTFIILFLIY